MANATTPNWMGDVELSEIGFPFQPDRSRYAKQTEIVYKETPDGPLHLDVYRPNASEVSEEKPPLPTNLSLTPLSTRRKATPPAQQLISKRLCTLSLNIPKKMAVEITIPSITVTKAPKVTGSEAGWGFTKVLWGT